MSAIGQLLGALFAAIAAGLAGVAFKLQRDEVADLNLSREQDRLERVRRDANRFVAWVQWGESDKAVEIFAGSPGGVAMRPTERSEGMCVFVKNAAETPMFECRVEWSWINETGRRDPQQTMPHGSGSFSLGTIAPDDCITRVVADGAVMPEMFRVVLSFRDAAQQRWTRDADGRLHTQL